MTLVLIPFLIGVGLISFNSIKIILKNRNKINLTDIIFGPILSILLVSLSIFLLVFDKQMYLFGHYFLIPIISIYIPSYIISRETKHNSLLSISVVFSFCLIIYILFILDFERIVKDFGVTITH